jgi:hypothetical protein
MTGASWKPPADTAARAAVELLTGACRRVEEALALYPSNNVKLKNVLADLDEVIEKMARQS